MKLDYSKNSFCRGCRLRLDIRYINCPKCGYRVAHKPKNPNKKHISENVLKNPARCEQTGIGTILIDAQTLVVF